MFQTPNGPILNDESIPLSIRFEGGEHWFSEDFRILDNDSIRSSIILGQAFLNRHGLVTVNDHLFPLQEVGPPTQGKPMQFMTVNLVWTNVCPEEIDAMKAAEAAQLQKARELQARRAGN